MDVYTRILEDRLRRATESRDAWRALCQIAENRLSSDRRLLQFQSSFSEDAMSKANFLPLLKLIAPIVLASIPALRPAAPFIVPTLEAAEETFGDGNGALKLAAAKEMASNAIQMHNAARPSVVIDHDAAMGAFDAGVSTAIDAVKVIQGVKQALPKQQNIGDPQTNPRAL